MSKTILQAIDAEIEAHKKWIVQHGRCLEALKTARAALTDGLSADQHKTGQPFHPLKPPPKLGEIMPDGTVYVGVSPDTGRAIFAMPHHLPSRMTWTEAQKAVTEQSFGGYSDWRLPTRNEMEHLFQTKVLSGGIYWSAKEYNRHDAWYLNCTTGLSGLGRKISEHLVRCIRG